MKSRGYFRLLTLLILFSQGIFIGWLLEKDFSWTFVLMEILTLCILILLAVIYKKIIRPLQVIGNGMDLLKEQDFSSRLGYVGQRDADRIVEVFNRMMLQLKNERLHVREQNHFLDLLVQSSPVGVVILDSDRKILSVNPAAVKIFGLPAAAHAQGKGTDEIDSPVSAGLSLIKRGESVTIRLKDASIYKCSCATFVESGFPHLFYLIEPLTEEVRRAEKKAYGQVIRMIAHEVNNTMAGVISSLEMLGEIREERENRPEREECGNTDGGEKEILSVLSERCHSLSRFITHFAEVVKIPDPRLERISLNEFVRCELRFLESVCAGRRIKIRTLFTCSESQVLIDPTLWEQVLLNIVKNAAEAIGKEGEIIISTEREPAPGTGIFLEISNNGEPISPQVQGRLFAPFFSTKSNGRGIGLMLIREILQKHGCRFSLQTYPDGLTRFRVRLERA